MSASFTVEGGRPLSGSIVPQGAKNEALQIISATLLTAEKVTISNIPAILDVLRLIDLLKVLGSEVEQISPDTYSFQARDIRPEILVEESCKSMVRGLRGSVMLLGPLLARFGKSYMVKPGGDKIGRRRLDTHFIGLQKLGADFKYDPGQELFEVTAPGGLKGNYILLDEASVTGTANLIMAAVLTPGTTTIYHAACEPYIGQLCRMLNRMGADISGIGSNLLTVRGVKELGGTDHRMLADMIEVGSFIGMASMTRSDLTIDRADVVHLGIIPDTFRRLGIELEIDEDKDQIRVNGSHPPVIDTYLDGSILTLSDHPWPGLTPDLLSVLLVTAVQCKGTVLIHQKMFESRLFFVDKLLDMGAQIILCDPHRATVIGLGRNHVLRAISMSSPDIRAGVALLIAALSADGNSTIFNIEQIDRGYREIDTRLNLLGANIQRNE